MWINTNVWVKFLMGVLSTHSSPGSSKWCWLVGEWLRMRECDHPIPDQLVPVRDYDAIREYAYPSVSRSFPCSCPDDCQSRDKPVEITPPPHWSHLCINSGTLSCSSRNVGQNTCDRIRAFISTSSSCSSSFSCFCMSVLIRLESATSLIMTSQKCRLPSPNLSLSNSKLRTYVSIAWFFGVQSSCHDYLSGSIVVEWLQESISQQITILTNKHLMATIDIHQQTGGKRIEMNALILSHVFWPTFREEQLKVARVTYKGETMLGRWASDFYGLVSK